MDSGSIYEDLVPAQIVTTSLTGQHVWVVMQRRTFDDGSYRDELQAVTSTIERAKAACASPAYFYYVMPFTVDTPEPDEATPGFVHFPRTGRPC